MKRPAGYPVGWHRRGCTADGRRYRIRPIRPDDLDRERAFVGSLSDTSRYYRLMHSMRELPAGFLERLVGVDYRHTMAFVAVTGTGAHEEIVGVARYAADADRKDAEFAVVVADAWQSRGIGSMLMRVLFEYARARGFRRLYGSVLADNDRMLQLAHRLGLEARTADTGELQVWKDLQGGGLEPDSTLR